MLAVPNIQNKPRPQVVAENIVKGAVSNTFATFVTLPLVTIFVSRQTTPDQSTFAIAKKVLTARGLSKAYSASPTFMIVAPLKATAYIGVSNAVFEHYRDEKGLAARIKAGAVAGVSSALAESVIDAWGLPKAIAKWNQGQKTNSLSAATAFMRCYRASLTKNMVANSLTLGVVYTAKYALAHQTQIPTSMQPALAGMLGPMTVGLIIAPLVYLESNTANNPALPMSQHFQQAMTEKAVKKLWSGAGTRIVQRSLASAITFFTLDKINQWQIQGMDAKQSNHYCNK